MKHNQKFEQRWEFKRRATASNVNGSNLNMIPGLVLAANADDSKCQTGHYKVEKMKNVPKKIKKKANVNVRKTKIAKNKSSAMKDLKIFADSLIQELSAARESMLDHMKEELRKLESRKPNKLQPRNKLRASPMGRQPTPQFQTQRSGVHFIPQGVPKSNPGIRFSGRIGEFQPQELWVNHHKSVGLVTQNTSCVRGTSRWSMSYFENSSRVGERMNARFSVE